MTVTEAPYRVAAETISNTCGQTISSSGVWNMMQRLGERIDEETLAQVKYIFSKEEEIIQFLLDNNNWENNCKTLATISLNDVLEENFRNMCDNAYNDFSKKAYNASNDCNDFSEKAYSSFNEE